MLDEKKASILVEGDKFGDYTVVKLLGAGGMGAVYLMQGASGTMFAVKIMFPDKMSHDMRRRFAREAEFAIKIRHKNLVSVYDVGEDPETGLCYMIMDYMPGGTLADMLQRRGRVPLDKAVSIASQVAFGLEVAHRHGIVHRDVKPENILFAADGTPKLADLGVAKFDEGPKSMVTATGMVIGTPVYMAPEQMLNSHQIDARADIYSLGVVLYEMLSGKRPNEGRTAIELMTKAIKGEPLPDIRTMCPELSVVVAHVVSLLCAPKPEERPQTAFESAVLLRKAASGKFKLARKKPQSSTAEAAARRERRRRLLKVTAIGSVLAAFLFIGLAGWIKALNRQEPVRTLGESPATNALERTIAVTNAVETAAANAVAPVPAVTPPQNATNAPVSAVTPPQNATNAPVPVVTSQSTAPSQPVEGVKKQKTDRQKAKARGVTDRRVRYAKVGSHKWYYTLETGEAVIWRGNFGYNRETRPAVDPSNDEEIIVPAELDGYKVKAIGNLAFFRCTALKFITIPEGVREIRGWSFFYCENLKSIHIPTSLRRIGSGFVSSQLLEMVDIRNCTDVCGYAFRFCPRLSKVTVSETNPAYVEIGGVLYTKDKETLVFFPNAPASVSLPSFVKRIGEGAFCSSGKLTSVLVPTNVIEIKASAFSCCRHLADVRIEHGLRTVGNSAFSSCSKLRNICFPASLERIGDSLFSDSMNLERVTFYGNAPTFNDSRQVSLLGKTSLRLVIAVKRGTKGWKAPGSTELPEVWPVEGFDDSRPIKFLDTLGTAESSPHAQIAPPVKLAPTAKTSPQGEKIGAVPNNGGNNLDKRNNQGNMNDGFPFVSYRFDRNSQKYSANLKGQVSQLIQELDRTMGGAFSALMQEKKTKLSIFFEDKNSVKQYSSDSSKGIFRVSSRSLRSRPGHTLYYLAQELIMIALCGERPKKFYSSREPLMRIICEYVCTDALFAVMHSSDGGYSSSRSNLARALEVDPNMDSYDFDGNPMGKRRPAKDLMYPSAMREAKVFG